MWECGFGQDAGEDMTFNPPSNGSQSQPEGERPMPVARRVEMDYNGLDRGPKDREAGDKGSGDVEPYNMAPGDGEPMTRDQTCGGGPER